MAEEETFKQTLSKMAAILAFGAVTFASGTLMDKAIEKNMDGKSHWYRAPGRGLINNYEDDRNSARVWAFAGAAFLGGIAGFSTYALMEKRRKRYEL